MQRAGYVNPGPPEPMPLTVEQIVAKVKEMGKDADDWCPDSDEEMNWYQGKARGMADLLNWIEEQTNAV